METYKWDINPARQNVVQTVQNIIQFKVQGDLNLTFKCSSKMLYPVLLSF